MFLTKKNQLVDCPDAEALASFKHSVRDEWLATHLGQEKPRTMAALTSLVTRFCAGEDSWLARCSTSDPSTSEVRDGNGKSRCRKDQRRNKENGSKNTAVNAEFKSSRPNNKTLPLKDNSDELSNLNKILDRICQIHSTPGSLQTTPTEIVGSSNSSVGSTPNTRGSTRQARMTTNPTSRAQENKRLSHKKSK